MVEGCGNIPQPNTTLKEVSAMSDSNSSEIPRLKPSDKVELVINGVREREYTVTSMMRKYVGGVASPVFTIELMGPEPINPWVDVTKMGKTTTLKDWLNTETGETRESPCRPVL